MTAKRITIVLLEDFADWEVGVFAAAARAWLGAELSYVTPGGKPVRSMGGLVVTPDAALDILAEGRFDALVAIGSSRWEAADAPDIGPVIRTALAAGKPVGGICGATLALARSGVLTGRRHTSNAKAYPTEHVAGYDSSLYVETPKAVVDGKLVTAPGTAPASFATALIGLIWPGHPLAEQLGAMIAAEHLA